MAQRVFYRYFREEQYHIICADCWEFVCNEKGQ